MKDIRLNTRLVLAVVIIYIIGKFVLRPHVMSNNYPDFMLIFVMSLPNFCEAVCGVLILTNIALVSNFKFFNNGIKFIYLYIGVVIFSSAYVILQELKIHNLGGQNIYDPYDVLFSIVGLLLSLIYLLLKKPKYKLTT